MKRSERTELKKSLSPAAIWAVALGSIIGWGCFIQGANWTARAGGPLPLMIGFVVGGILMSIVGKSYSYMIAKFPVAGGGILPMPIRAMAGRPLSSAAGCCL